MLSNSKHPLPSKKIDQHQVTSGSRPSSNPRRATPKAKESQIAAGVNIIYDRRICRGNTHALPAIQASAVEYLNFQKRQEHTKRIRAQQKAETMRVMTSNPVDGRKNMDVQTDLYLEELSDKVPEAIAMTQTDPFMDRPESPLYIPKKSGSDAETQIYDGELFDFNFEVQPLLEIIVGKTLEQALMELNEEEEIAILKEHRRKYEDIRNADFVEVQRLEDAERRRFEEKGRRIKERQAAKIAQQIAADQIAARETAQNHLRSLIPNVLENLATNGYFTKKIEIDLNAQFLPWLTDAVDKNMQSHRLATKLSDGI